jgi:hypothetical protein
MNMKFHCVSHNSARLKVESSYYVQDVEFSCYLSPSLCLQLVSRIFISWLLTEVFQSIAFVVSYIVPSWLNRRDSK